MSSTVKFDTWRNAAGDTVYDGSRGALPISRNLLYNGAMQVAQRGASETGITTSGYYTADRWRMPLTTGGTWTQTVGSDGPTGSGFTKSLKVECTTANSSLSADSQIVIQQQLEGQDLQGLKKGTADAESLSLSFWVKSNTTGTYIVEMLDANNNRHICASYSVSVSGTWERKTILLPGDTTGAFNNDNGSSLRLSWWLGAGTDFTSGTLQTSWGARVNANRAVGQVNLAAATSNYWQITGVQLETGEVASPFEHKPYGVELAECQRYYQIIENPSGFNQLTIMYARSSTTARGFLMLKQTMRTIPSGSVTGCESLQLGSGDFTVTCAMESDTTDNIEIAATGSGFTVGQAGAITMTPADKVEMDAEL